MEDRTKAPKQRDTTELPDGSMLGIFWMGCKNKRRCGRPPYDRLLTNPVLKNEYHTAAVKYCCGTKEQQLRLSER